MTRQAREEILAECALAFAGNSDDCNKYLKAVAAPFFDPDLFTGPAMNADAIVKLLRQGGDWTLLGTSHPKAIEKAKAGLFVVAGMASTELGDAHGHLAVVVGDDGQKSGDVIVPICYAGSLGATGRVQRKKVSETFGTKPARESRISYFAREVQTIPASAAVSRLVDQLRGVSIPSAELPLVALAAARSGVARPARAAPAKRSAAKAGKSASRSKGRG